MTVSPATDVARRRVLRQLLRNPQGAVCLAFLALVALVAVTSPWLAPYSPTETDLDATNAAPFSAGHLLGGDSAGRDILSRLMWGSRQTVLACAIILLISLAVGVTSGLVAGFYRGRFEAAAGF